MLNRYEQYRIPRTHYRKYNHFAATKNGQKYSELSATYNKETCSLIFRLIGILPKFYPQLRSHRSSLSDKTKNKEPNKIDWGTSQQLAFDKLEKCLASEPILKLPNFEATFTLRTDASDLGIGAVLLQEQNGTQFPVACAVENY